MGKRYNIAFKGEVAAGFDIREVKAFFAERFRKNAATVERIFSGRPITLAKDLEWERANTAATRLLQHGAVVYLVDLEHGGSAGETPRSANDSDVHATLDPDSSIYARMATPPQEPPPGSHSGDVVYSERFRSNPENAAPAGDPVEIDHIAAALYAAAKSSAAAEPDTVNAEQLDEEKMAELDAKAKAPGEFLDEKQDPTLTIAEDSSPSAVSRMIEAEAVDAIDDAEVAALQSDAEALTMEAPALEEEKADATARETPQPRMDEPTTVKTEALLPEPPRVDTAAPDAGHEETATAAPVERPSPVTPAPAARPTPAATAPSSGVVVENLAGDAMTDLTATAKIRHLSQIMDKRVLRRPEAPDAKKAAWRYRFDTFMARGGGSIFKALTAVFVAAFLLIGVARGVLMYFFPETSVQHEDIGFLGNLYITFLEITDPGNMAQDIYSSAALKVFAVLAGIAGIVMLSALIAFITTALDQKIYELKRGRSKVIEEGHTLILGWNEQRIIEIIRELTMANESEKDACVVILADKDKEEMDDVLRLRVKDLATTRLVTRSGDVSTLSNLDMVSLESCKAVIILASCDETDSASFKASSDAKAIQTVLATMGKEEGKDEFSVVVEIFNPTHRDIVRSSFPDHVITVNTSDILAKLLVQTSRSVGLSVVYNEILSFDGCEMYFYDAEWNNAAFGEIGYHFPDGVPVGIRDAGGGIHINPPADRVLDANDEILIIADDDSTIELLESPVALPQDHALCGRRHEQRIERELMIGWTFKSPIIIREFADYIMAGSAIHILVKNPSEQQHKEVEALQQELDGIDIRLLQKDCLSIEELMSVRPFDYDNIIILAGSEEDGQPVDAGRVDSENIVALLLLRRIFSQYPVESMNTKLITEILDSQNDELVARAGVQDVIISNRLVSMIMAQISESADIEVVYDDIFQEDGSEIYLKPASLYFDKLPMQLSFADMMAIAQKREEICIGVKIKSLEPEKEHNNGVQLIPEKNTMFNLQPDDSLVVLAEDEL